MFQDSTFPQKFAIRVFENWGFFLKKIENRSLIWEIYIKIELKTFYPKKVFKVSEIFVQSFLM